MLKRWGGWFILIGFAIATTWFVQNLEEKFLFQEETLTSTPDYTLTNFKSTRMDEHGQLKNQLTAKTMTHYPDANAKLMAPYMIFYKKMRQTWTVQAERGEVSPDGYQVWLQGQTVLQQYPQNQQPPMKIISQDVWARLDTEYAETAAPTIIYHNNGKTNSVGMRVFMPIEQIELLSQVRGHYVQ
jgi:LPS export ABC transporter protein LptC